MANANVSEADLVRWAAMEQVGLHACLAQGYGELTPINWQSHIFVLCNSLQQIHLLQREQELQREQGGG